MMCIFSNKIGTKKKKNIWSLAWDLAEVKNFILFWVNEYETETHILIEQSPNFRPSTSGGLFGLVH